MLALITMLRIFVFCLRLTSEVDRTLLHFFFSFVGSDFLLYFPFE